MINMDMNMWIASWIIGQAIAPYVQFQIEALQCRLMTWQIEKINQLRK
jgi:hypothetical protein